MYDTRDIGKLFVHTLKVTKKSRIISRGFTQEAEVPFRTSASWVIHFPGFSKALAIGWWKDSGFDVEEADEFVNSNFDNLFGAGREKELTEEQLFERMRKTFQEIPKTEDGRVLY